MQANLNIADASKPLPIKGVVMRTAKRLIKWRGSGALGHANHKAELMQERDDEEDVVFWKRIAKQVEILLNSKE